MIDKEKIIKGLECHRIDNNHRINCADCPYYVDDDNHIRCVNNLHDDALALLKEQQSLLGIQQTADGITFLSTGTAKQGEERGLMLGKLTMHEWLEKELLYRGLLTDEIRAVFNEAKRI